MRRRRRSRGATLILALLLLVLVAVVVAAAASRTQRVARERAVQRAEVTATQALTGAVEHARWSLARDAAHAGETLRIGAADVEVVVSGDGDSRLVEARTELSLAPYAGASVHVVRAELALRDDGRLPLITAWRE